MAYTFKFLYDSAICTKTETVVIDHTYLLAISKVEFKQVKFETKLITAYSRKLIISENHKHIAMNTVNSFQL